MSEFLEIRTMPEMIRLALKGLWISLAIELGIHESHRVLSALIECVLELERQADAEEPTWGEFMATMRRSA